jgi:glycosyltransferase involved in cell wall biosynthesis
MTVSVIIPAHNPHASRLQRTLAGLRAQTLPVGQWETILVDNASTPPIDLTALTGAAPSNARVVGEPQLGLTAARRRGFREARGEYIVLVDDDNLLAPDYLATALTLFEAHPKMGLMGGRSLPEFTGTPPEWTREFHQLLALRDFGPDPLITQGLQDAATGRIEYPAFAPIGAGMALRRAAVDAWLTARGEEEPALSDRRGGELTSSGDNDIVLCAMHAGWAVGYFPALSLTHLIPASRLEAGYLARLNRGIQQSWMRVLTLHHANPWPPLTPAGARLRKVKAWFTHQAWRNPAAQIRWQGACGHFDGRVPRD